MESTVEEWRGAGGENDHVVVSVRALPEAHVGGGGLQHTAGV